MGHYIAARLTGIKVEEFAFGFGPRLVRLFKRGDTEYTIHAAPLGGFVKLAGMEPGQEDIPDGFQAQAIWKRALVIFAGPFMSFVLAVLIFLMVGVFWGFPDESRAMNRIAQVNPHTIAANVGLRAGDTILAIDGRRISEGKKMIDTIHSSPGRKLTLSVQRGKRKFGKTVAPAWYIDYLGALWSFMQPGQGVADGVAKHSAAARAGVEPKDELVSINGQRITSGGQMVEAIGANGSRPVEIILARNGQSVKIRAVPEVEWVAFAGAKWFFPGGYPVLKDNASAKSGSVQASDTLVSANGTKIETGRQLLGVLGSSGDRPVDLVVDRGGKQASIRVAADHRTVSSGLYDAQGRIGFVAASYLAKTGFVESIQTGLRRTGYMIEAVMGSLAPSRIGESVGGPVLIAKQTSSMVALGVYYVITMAGVLSLSLAIINLFPIPVLDGGHLAILGVEAIRRKRLTPAQMQAVQMVGLAMLAVIVVAVLFSDVTKIIGGQLPQ